MALKKIKNCTKIPQKHFCWSCHRLLVLYRYTSARSPDFPEEKQTKEKGISLSFHLLLIQHNHNPNREHGRKEL